MEIIPAEIENVIASLAETPDRIASLTKGFDGARLRFRPDEDTWSVNDILAHLRSCADVWGKTIETMLAEDHPTFRHLSPRTYIKKTNYLDLAFSESFQAYVQQRSQLLNRLKNLAVEDWARSATVEGRKYTQYTVLSQAQRIASHEHEHLEQIESLLK